MRLFFLGHVSSQYIVKNVAYFGGRFVSVVDQGWVEWRSGYGGAKILSNHYIKFLQVINRGSIPLFFLVGIFSFCLVLFL